MCPLSMNEHIIDSGRKRIFDFPELFRYKELFYFFTWRDIKVKYKQTALGLLWAVLQPLLMMLIFTFFFAKALNIPSQSLPYPVFVFSGLLLWNLFSSALNNASNSMVSNAAIIKKIYFPRVIIPLSSILVAVFDFFMGMILFIPLLIFYQQPVGWNILWSWPFALAISILASMGPGCLFAALNVKYRDFRYVIPFIIQVLFFLTPVLYPISLIKYPVLKTVVILSPMYAAIEMFRLPLTQEYPDWNSIFISLISGTVILLAGLYYFKRTEDFFADFA
jgi:lipopolysaccharide transport system permease protein